MSPKIARVIIVGLNENERHELDNRTRELLQVNDANWQYESHRCDTPEQAFDLAAELKNIDIIYIGREDDGLAPLQQMAHVHSLFSRVATLKKQPVVSLSLWKGQAAAAQTGRRHHCSLERAQQRPVQKAFIAFSINEDGPPPAGLAFWTGLCCALSKEQ